MTAADYKEFCETWLAFCAGKQGRMPDKKALSVIFSGLAPLLSLEELHRGLALQAIDSDFMPTLSSVLRYAKGRTQDRAVMAWLVIKKAMRRLGSAKSVRFSDPAAMFAVDSLGGWYELNFAENTDWLYKRFCDAYTAAVNLGVQAEDVPDHFAGDLEMRSSSWSGGDVVTVRGFGKGGKIETTETASVLDTDRASVECPGKIDWPLKHIAAALETAEAGRNG